MSALALDKNALVAKCDRLWRELIERRDRGRCRRCGKPGHEAAHIFSRGVRFTRWLAENGLWLCRTCHHTWGHANPQAFQEWARGLLGPRAFAILRRKWSTAGAVKVDLVQTKARLVRALRAYYLGGI